MGAAHWDTGRSSLPMVAGCRQLRKDRRSPWHSFRPTTRGLVPTLKDAERLLPRGNHDVLEATCGRIHSRQSPTRGLRRKTGHKRHRLVRGIGTPNRPQR